MANFVKTVKFYNGVECPVLGLGTYRGKNQEVYDAVKHAIRSGYRHIDTALIYGNEADVGRAINDSIKESAVKREEIFVVTKLPGSCNRPNLVVPCLKKSLSTLKLSFIDLYLIHTPISRVPLGDDILDSNGKLDENGDEIMDDINPVDTWKAMETCVDLGLAKNIGVSNFNSQQLQAVLDDCRIKPVTNQVECHPFLPQTKLRKFCKDRGILITTYRALGGEIRNPDEPSILDHEVVKKLAVHHSKSPAQILLRWQVQQNDLIVLAKSTNFQRIESHTAISDFELSDEDMNELAKLECNCRYRPFLEGIANKHYPFHIEY